MARASVEVPEELVEAVRETVLLLYRATAESLHQALRAGDQAEAHSHRARIDELDELARALAERKESPAEPAAGARGVRLTASRDLLHDALYGALIDAGERLAGLSSDAWRGQVPPERIQEAAGVVLSLNGLLRGLSP
jgi:hypothetical protein